MFTFGLLSILNYETTVGPPPCDTSSYCLVQKCKKGYALVTLGCSCKISVGGITVHTCALADNHLIQDSLNLFLFWVGRLNMCR